MTKPNSLTEAQTRIVRTVGAFEERGDPPFVPDLAKALGLAGESSLAPTLRILEREGFATVRGGGSKGRSRVVRLTARGRYAVALGGIPLLGSIPAGPLEEAIPEVVLEEREVLNVRPGDFLLRARGDSMIGDGILNGDKVLLRPGIDVNPGEIAAVLVGDAHEATLKHVISDEARGEVILRASNPFYVDVRVPGDQVKIAGVYRGLVRDVEETRAGDW
ncbi:MAG: S24 family peptidase [Chthoniobacterales bacterium]